MPSRPASISPPTAKYVEARFVLSKAMVKILENFLFHQMKPPTAAGSPDSSFIVAAAYVWCCLAMSARNTVADDEPELLAFAMAQDSPHTYSLVESTHGTLKGKGCFVAATEAIIEAISSGSRTELPGNPNRNRKLVVCMFDAYSQSVDYGWGRPRQKMFSSCTFLGNGIKQVEIFRSREGGVEILMRMPRIDMEAFAVIFDGGLVEAQDLLHLITSSL